MSASRPRGPRVEQRPAAKPMSAAPVVDLLVAAQVRAARLIELSNRDALTLEEAAELGYGCERTLRQMVNGGVLQGCAIRVGKRGVRLLRVPMIEILQRAK